MTEVAEWKKVDIENTKLDELTLSAPQGSYWQKMMGAIARKTDGIESRLQTVETGGGGWVWNPTPIYSEELAEGFSYDIEADIPYRLPAAVFGDGLEAALILIEKNVGGGAATLPIVGRCYWDTSVTGLGGIIDGYFQVSDTTVATFSACFLLAKEHGLYVGRPFSRLRQAHFWTQSIPDAPLAPAVYVRPEDSTGRITSFSFAESIPQGATVTVYAPL